MIITARELFEFDTKNQVIIKIKDKSVTLYSDNVFMPKGDSEDEGETEDVIIFFPEADAEDLYCKHDTSITLDEFGCGTIELYLDLNEWLDADQRTVTLPITVRANVPFTDAIRTKLLLGAL
ncbi:hypothetical protein MIF8_89 [Erwinia phage MIF8]